jgi:hypothetical protein
LLAEIFERLDQWVTDENNSAGMAGFRLIPKSIFRVVGHIYKGQLVHAVRADTHCIMVSKALKSPKKTKCCFETTLRIVHRNIFSSYAKNTMSI